MISRTFCAAVLSSALAIVVGTACGPATEPGLDSVSEPAAPVDQSDAGYVGAGQCTGCHAEIAETFSHTGMGRSLYPMTEAQVVEDFANDNEIVIPGTGLRYRMIERDGRYYQRQFVTGSDGNELVADEREMIWVIGSNHHARSYVTRVGDRLFQMPVCWYPDPQHWELCPGYEHGNDHFSREIDLTCVFCHNGRMVPAEGATNAYLEPIPHGIGCERCHGPGKAHVDFWTSAEEAPLLDWGTIVNPAKLPREERIQLCFQCHFGDSKASERVLRRGRSLLEFRPGMSITDVMMPFHLREVSTLEFGLSAQADRLIRSRCYVESDGELECLTCHDPHVTVYSDDRPAGGFREKCLGCHDVGACTAPAAARAATALPDDCVECHMRTAEADDQRFAVFTDHWIRKRIEELGEKAFVPETVPVFPEAFAELSPAEQAFYRGRAHMLTAMDLPGPARQAMWSVAESSLKSAIEQGLDDADTRVFRGMVLDFEGRLPEAAEAFARAHAEDPAHRDAAFNLGTARLRMGNVREAETLFRELVERDPEDVGALAELGRCALLTDRSDEALRIYDRAIPLAPTLASLRTNRGAALAKLGRLEEAAKAVEAAAGLSPDTPDVWIFWAELLERTGRPAEASEARSVATRLKTGS